MIFCGHCGYQLSARDKVCPRCGAETDIDLNPDLITHDPEINQPTEMSQVTPNFPQPSSDNQLRRSTPTAPPQPAGPLVLGSAGGHYANAQDATTVMSSPAASAPQQFYAPQAGAYGQASYPQYYQDPQSAALAQILAASRRGKTNSLLLILFGLILLIAAIIVFLLNQQGIILTS